MAIERKYFTYTTDIFINSDYPGGAWRHPNDFIRLNFGNSVIQDDWRLYHYEEEDCRFLTSATGDNTKLTFEQDKTLLNYMIEDSLNNFNAKLLTDEEALTLARHFSPARTVNGFDDQENEITITFSEYNWDESTPPKLVQTVTTAPKS